MSLPQTTGGKDEPNIVFMQKSQRTLQHGTKSPKTHNMTSQKTKKDEKNTITTKVPRNMYLPRIAFYLFRNCSFISIKHIINLYLDINDCHPDPCQNGGTCVDGVDSYTCNCPAGFTAANCQTSKCFLYLRCSFISSEGECIRTVLFNGYYFSIC